MGPAKPRDINDYMGPFCDELEELQETGIQLENGVVKTIKINAFIADTPARSFLTGTMNFNAKHGCHRCHQQTTSTTGKKRFFF